MNPKVVIIGHSYSSRLSLIRAVSQIGCEITVVVMAQPKDKKSTPVKPIDCYSKYVSRFYYCVRRERDSLVPLLLEKCVDPNQKVVLIPDGDDVVAAIDNNKDRLKEHFLFPHIAKEPSSMEYWMEKTHQKQLAKEIGLNVTNATIVEIKDGQYTIPSDLQYPVFPKPLATMNEGKVDMKGCNNPKELSEFNARSKKVLDDDYVFKQLQSFCDKELRLYLKAFKSPSQLKLRLRRFFPGAYNKWLFRYNERDLMFTLHTLRSEQNRETAIVGIEHLLSL